jgi:DNA polymerase-3 subunit delta
MGPSEFQRRLDGLLDAPVVLCTGPSAWLAELALGRMAAGCAEGAERVESGDEQLREACELAATPSFFGGRRLVAAWRTGALSGQEGRGAQQREREMQALLAYMERPGAEAKLFVWAPAADRRLGPVRRAMERGWLLEADVGRDTPAWLQELAKLRDVTLTPAATQAFLQSGLDLDSLATALAAAALATDEGQPVSGATAAWAAPPQVEMRVFALTDAILQRRPAGVAEAARQLTAAGEAPLGLLALVTRQLRQLASARAELAAGRPAGELPKVLGAHPFVAQKLAEAAPRWNALAIAQAFRELLRCDVALKSGGSQAIALELGLLRVAMAGR